MRNKTIFWTSILFIALMVMWCMALLLLRIKPTEQASQIKVDTVYYTEKPYYPVPKYIGDSAYYDTVVFTEEDSILSSY